MNPTVRLDLLIFCLITARAWAATTVPPNVLFISIDDLRPALGAYGDAVAKTPHIDTLAQKGTRFTRAYTQIANCNPSRASLLTGLRPDTTRIFDLVTHFRKTVPDAVTLPEHFKQHGYHTQCFGKVFHSAVRGGLEDPQSWSVPATPSAHDRGDGKASVAPDVDDDALEDGRMAKLAVSALGELNDRKGQPFFLAIGFRKPHLPFMAPKKYFDLHSPEAMRLVGNPSPPRDVPPIALNGLGELKRYEGVPREPPLPDELAREVVRGYYAATSYTDALVGQVLAELDRLDLRRRTIVVLWSDHGFQLGEHAQWCKHTNFETAVRVPLIVSVPGQSDPGAQSAGLVELVDLYPTLCDLAGLPVPVRLEGRSFAPLLKQPARKWKKAVFSQFPRGEVMGVSMRTDRYRYAEWAEPNQPPVGVELYDHETDSGENVNLAARPESTLLVSELSKQLRAGWRAAGPQ